MPRRRKKKTVLKKKMGRFRQILGNTFLVQQLYGSKYAPHIGKFHIPYAYVKAMLFAASADDLAPPERRYIEGLVEILLPASDAQMIENRVEIVLFIEAVPTSSNHNSQNHHSSGSSGSGSSLGENSSSAAGSAKGDATSSSASPPPYSAASSSSSSSSSFRGTSSLGAQPPPPPADAAREEVATTTTASAATTSTDSNVSSSPFSYIGIEDDESMLPPSFYAAYKAQHPTLVIDCHRDLRQPKQPQQPSSLPSPSFSSLSSRPPPAPSSTNHTVTATSGSSSNNSSATTTTTTANSNNTDATNDKNISTFLSGSMLTSPVLSRVLLYDAIRAASADGVFSAEERDHVRRVSKQLGISENVRLKLEKISERETELVKRKSALLSRI